MKISLPILSDMVFRLYESTEKVWWEWYDSFQVSHLDEHGHFLPLFTIQSQLIEQTTTLHFTIMLLSLIYLTYKDMVKQMPWNDSLSKIVPIYIRTGCSNFDCRVLKPSLSSLKPSICTQKYSRLRCLLRVKGLVIGFYLGWSGHTLLIRKI